VASRHTARVTTDAARAGPAKQPRSVRRLTGQPMIVSDDLDPVDSAPQQRDDNISNRRKVPRQLAQLADRLATSAAWTRA
jgi:hypothetical protein